MGRKISVDNALLIRAALEAMARGKSVVLPLKGDSMRPLLKGGRDKARLTTSIPHLNLGDVVLAQVGEGRYVLHRVVEMDGDRITLMGDGNKTPEYCRREDVKAVATDFCIRGRWIGVRSPLLRFYCKVILRIVRLVRGLRGCLCQWSPRR